MTSASSTSSGPVRVLSLDGGGVRGFAELVMLEQLFQKLNHFRKKAKLSPQEPWEFFDIIGGTSTGGLIAVMLGRLRMSISACLEHYRTLSDQAFSKKNMLKRAWEGKVSPLDAHYDTAKLEEAIKFVVNDSGPSQLLQEEDMNSPCKVFVMSQLENLSRPACFRSYYNIEKSNELYETITIWEACRATSAATTFFDPIVIGGSRYSDGGLQYNNPISIAYAEALEMFPGRQLQIVSLGTGTARPKEYNPGLVTVAKQLAEIATATHNQTQVFLRNWNNANGQYFRFSPNFVGEIGLEEAGQLDEIRRMTVDWIEETETSKNFVACAKAISGATGESSAQPATTDQTGLLRAATSGDLKTLQKLLRSGMRIDVTDEQGRTCLFKAVNARRRAVVEELLRSDADVNITNKDGWSPLHEATSEGLAEIAALLIGAGANVHLRDSKDWPPLHWAAYRGHKAIAENLMRAGADPNCISRSDGWTALHFATCWRHHDVMLALIKGGADVNRPDRFHETPLDIAEDPERVDRSSNHTTVAILECHGAQNYQPESGGQDTSLRQMIENGNIESLCHALQSDFDHLASGEFHWLHDLKAGGYGLKDIAELLIDVEADNP